MQETNNQDAPTEEVEQPESNAEVSSSAEDSSETANQTSEEDTGESVINLDEYFIYDEPQDMDYRTTLEFYMTVVNSDGEEETVGYVSAEGGRTVTPDATTMTFNMEGNAGGGLGDTMIVTKIEGAFYYVMPPNECISLAVGQNGFENPFDLFLDTGGFLTEDAMRVLPDESINGVPSYHYALNQDNLLSWDVYEIYDADLYIAKEGGYVVRLLITGFGLSEADATAVQTAPGFFTYETQTSFEDVIAFYKTELTQDNEWMVTQEIIQEPNASVIFTGVDGTLMVNLGPGLTEGSVLVNILVTP